MGGVVWCRGHTSCQSHSVIPELPGQLPASFVADASPGQLLSVCVAATLYRIPLLNLPAAPLQPLHPSETMSG